MALNATATLGEETPSAHRSKEELKPDLDDLGDAACCGFSTCDACHLGVP